MREHNNLWCEIYDDTVIPDGRGQCSWCGAFLHELTVAEASRLIDLFEGLAHKRTSAQCWNTANRLLDTEAAALAVAKKTLIGQGRGHICIVPVCSRASILELHKLAIFRKLPLFDGKYFLSVIPHKV